jgi:methylated-DNA-protein-cysteine methyltransferase-like protein
MSRGRRDVRTQGRRPRDGARIGAPGPGGDFFQRVYAKVREVPRGRVATYGQIAALLGSPRAGRSVGWALRALEDGSGVPWHRVVDAQGRIRLAAHGGAAALQAALLRRDGIVVSRQGTIDLGRFLWMGRPGGVGLEAVRAAARGDAASRAGRSRRGHAPVR